MKIGIVGYGNLARSIEILAQDIDDLEICGIFTRREGSVVSKYAPVYSQSELFSGSHTPDVLILTLGSSSDLASTAERLSERYNTVDTFDTHSRISEYKERMNRSALSSGHTALLSFGWDPGLLSLFRLYLSELLPHSAVNTFWGKGVSQGHSEALRRIKGVKDAVEVTVPANYALSLASLVGHILPEGEKHRRLCYISKDSGDEEYIKEEAFKKREYFNKKSTEFFFVTDDDIEKIKSDRSHRGRIYASGRSGVYFENTHRAYFDIEVASNTELTAYIALRAAIICDSLAKEKKHGAFDILDLPPRLFIAENANNYL